MNELTLSVASDDAGERIDRYLARMIPDTSRSQIGQWIDAQRITVNGIVPKAKQAIRSGDTIVVTPPHTLEPSTLTPEDLPLDILYDDADIIVLNKAPGMVVHPGAGRAHGTLVHALLARYPGMLGVGGVERPGIVHRLDHGTSGVMVVAKHDVSHRALVAQFAARTTEKIYRACCWGAPPLSGKSDAPIGRHPVDRKKMSTRSTQGKPALTYWTVRAAWQRAAQLDIRIATGRTHQIRVHLAALGYPLIGDALYGGRRVPAGADAALQTVLQGFTRPALHAWQLQITHPGSGQPMRFEAPLPEDFCGLIAAFAAAEKKRTTS